MINLKCLKCGRTSLFEITVQNGSRLLPRFYCPKCKEIHEPKYTGRLTYGRAPFNPSTNSAVHAYTYSLSGRYWRSSLDADLEDSEKIWV